MLKHLDGNKVGKLSTSRIGAKFTDRERKGLIQAAPAQALDGLFRDIEAMQLCPAID